jgi:zinc finger SWIM domain-containing protein 3
MNEIKFTVGELFKSYEELESKLEQFRKRNFIEVWIRESRKIQAAVGRVKKELNPAIVYYEICFACVHGGKKFQGRGKGHRKTK